ncbi:MAG TPA: DNA polymerase III subunit beta [Pseudomonadales bacterium]|nr:DNA polymerase III subunit beta [Pseudomonadales bacterium]
MQFSISREALLKPLQLVAGVVERRQTLPVLSNVLLVLHEGQLSLTGTDLEVELVGRVAVDEEDAQSGEITVPARKLLDIAKSLPDGATIKFSVENQKVTIKSGRSRFTLSTLPASEFPAVEDGPNTLSFELQQKQMKRLIDAVSFSMAQQDVRYYLNGMLLEIGPDAVRSVATDGHRLALCTLNMPVEGVSSPRQSILPRKGVMELVRFLADGDVPVRVMLGANHLRAQTEDFTFTTKLVDGKFPDYERVLPRGGNNQINADRQELRQAFSRAAILSNEKYRGVRLILEAGQLTLVANNPEQEEAEETVAIDYSGSSFEIGFNVSYLVDVLNALSSEIVRISLADANSSALIESADGSDALYVVMPMRL